MLHIEKRDPPEFLQELQKKYKTYREAGEDPSPWRKELRKCLLGEQHGLCGYCCGKITLETSHNEHMRPQAQHPDLSLAYDNIIASCCSTGHCAAAEDEEAKKGRDLCLVWPTDADCEAQFFYNTYNGEIQGKTEKARTTIHVLHLNCRGLKKARYAVLKGLVGFDYATAQKVYGELSPDRWMPFCNIARYVLRSESEWTAFQHIMACIGERRPG